MSVLVVFESMFGDNQLLAHAIAEGLSTRTHVDVVEVGKAPTVIEQSVELLVVGGPTHMASMSRPSSRQRAAREAKDGLVSSGIGLREWLAAVQNGSVKGEAVAFDTRLARPRWLRLLSSSTRGIQKGLKQRGFRMVAPPEHFLVAATAGPLLDGEAERARRWGEQLASNLPVGGPTAA